MKTEYSDVRASIMIKYILGNENLTVHVFKIGWRFPAEPVDFSISLGFDRDSFGQTIARGGMIPKAGPMIEFKIANKATENFLNQFAEAEWMWIRFDEGTEKPWPAKMYGSRNAATMFRKCVINLIESRSTQPYGKPPATSPQATQPYGKGGTQPFGSKPTQQPVRKPGVVKRDDGSI
jgi:hypothetical protein